MIAVDLRRLIHSDLPTLLKQGYGTELLSKTLASLKPEISQALDSVLDELRIAADSIVTRTAVSRFKFSSPRDSNRLPTPIRQASTRWSAHYAKKQALQSNSTISASGPTYLPRTVCTSSRQHSLKKKKTAIIHMLTHPELHDFEPNDQARISRRVSTIRPPQLNAFKQQSVRLTLETDAETSTIKMSLTRSPSSVHHRKCKDYKPADLWYNPTSCRRQRTGLPLTLE